MIFKRIYKGENQKIRVAEAQLSPIFLDIQATIERACQAILEAGENSAILVALRESFIPGYPFYAHARAAVTNDMFDRMFFDKSISGYLALDHIIDTTIRQYTFEAQAFTINASGLMSEEMIESQGDSGKHYKPGAG